MIDLSAMRELTVPRAVATPPHRAVPLQAMSSGPVTGTVKAVGMAGLTLAGGYGPLNGKFGLALDNLLGADVVLADRTRVTASDADERDLYWAVRGGGNFGVVTTARYRLHPLPFVLAGHVLFPLSRPKQSCAATGT